MNYQSENRNQLVKILPSFLIIGTQKGGTTSLYKYITQHPNVLAASKKEIHFFNNDKNFKLGMEWYKEQFAFKSEPPLKAITGEATPMYLFHPLAPVRIAQLLPSVKLIAILRNPVDRAYSHYQMRKRNGKEKRSFEEVIRHEKAQLSHKYLTSQNHHKMKLVDSCLSRGIYIDQVKRWLDLFPKEQLLIKRFEDFKENPQQITNDVLQFLGLEVDNFQIKNFHNFNPGNYKPIDPVTRQKLASFYKPYNLSLEETLGMKFNWDI